MEYYEKLKDKGFHRKEALRVAIENQLKEDYKNFNKTKIMRCWDCVGFLKKDLEKIEKELK